MFSWITFAVLSLGTWRITHMLVKEQGPLHIFERMRYAVGIRRKIDNPEETYAAEDTFLATVLECPLCTSVWIGGFFFAVALLSLNVAFLIALPFALSAVACLLFKLEDHL